VMRVPRGGHVGFPATTTLGQNAPLVLLRHFISAQADARVVGNAGMV
jgi:hypothetical protein